VFGVRNDFVPFRRLFRSTLTFYFRATHIAMFADIQALSQLTAVGYSAGGGLGMGVSPVADCLDKYKRNEGGVDMCADGNATDNWDTPPAAGWGYYNNSEYAERCTMRRGTHSCCTWSMTASLFR